MIKAIIIEDNKENRDVLLSFLKEYFPQIEIIGTAESNAESIELISANKFDLAFVDIELKDGYSFETLNKFYPIDFQLIFITAYEQEASKIIKYAAVDYLLKPLELNEFKASVSKALKLINNKAQLELLNQQMEFINHWRKSDVKYPERIVIQGVSEAVFLKIDEIVRCEAQGSYCEFYTIKKEKYMASKTLKEYEEILDPQQFLRVHKSHLINKKYAVKYLKEDGGVVVMEDGSNVLVSRRNKDMFIQNML